MNNIQNSFCISQNTAGLGGVAGGGGFLGQASQLAQGFGARSYGIPVIRITTGMKAQFQFRLTKDIQGTVPSDLCDVDRAVFICLDCSNLQNKLFQVQCQIQADGYIHLQLGPKQINNIPGIHYAIIQCYDRDQCVIKVFKCILEIQPGFTGNATNNRPITIGQVRMAVFDTCAQQNVLLDDLEFSDVQIVYSLQRAISDWNDMAPALHDNMTICNFPYKSKLCVGAIGHLLTMAAYRYLRNQMRHSNAGLTYDDQDKGQLYMQLGQANKQQWTSWVQTKKTQLNMQQCMGTISDAYHQSDLGRWWY